MGNPLVSIVVITYNSSKFVLETLESAKAQTYKNLELIVTDDCSTDNTLEICNNWIDQNKERFINVKLVTTEKNTGIAPNCNRGFKAAKGEWVKLIAGDDILLPDCINDYINASSEHPNSTFWMSTVNVIPENQPYRHLLLYKRKKFMKSLDSLTAEQQLKFYLSKSGREGIPAPSLFYKIDLLKKLNGFNEEYPMMEDRAFIINALQHGNKLYFLNKDTAAHRFTDSVMHRIDNKDYVINTKYFDSVVRFQNDIQYPLLVKYNFLFAHVHLRIMTQYNKLIIKRGNKPDNITLVLKLFKFLSPYRIIDIVNNRFMLFKLNKLATR